MINMAQAVASLRPNTEWTMYDDDVEGIIWHTENVKPLTAAEVREEVARLEQAEADSIATKEAARASAVAKLSALGLDADEVSALLSV